jgi:deoxyadenosine/deoxycytidine kinase
VKFNALVNFAKYIRPIKDDDNFVTMFYEESAGLEFLRQIYIYNLKGQSNDIFASDYFTNGFLPSPLLGI